MHHVVPEIVEPELVVGTVGDIRPVARGALRGVGLVLVDAVDGETEVGVDVTHPLGVALCKVRVNRYQVRALAHEGVEIERHGGHEGLSLPRRHLGHLAPVEGDRADELHVVRDHVPELLLAPHRHLGTEETAARFLDGREGFRKDLLENVMGFGHHPFVEIGQGLLQFLALEGILRVALLFPKFFYLGLDLSRSVGDARAEFLRFGLELFFGERLVFLETL